MARDLFHCVPIFRIRRGSIQDPYQVRQRTFHGSGGHDPAHRFAAALDHKFLSSIAYAIQKVGKVARRFRCGDTRFHKIRLSDFRNGQPQQLRRIHFGHLLNFLQGKSLTSQRREECFEPVRMQWIAGLAQIAR